MEKEEIKQKILNYFSVKQLEDLIGKTSKEWIDCANSILSEEKSAFEKITEGFSEDWKNYFTDLLHGRPELLSNADSGFSWISNMSSIRHDKFLQFLYSALQEKNFKSNLIKNKVKLRTIIHDFYNLTSKQFSTAYGTTSNIR